MRSIPEKTLEHWASMYLTYRYRSHTKLWWPAIGEDVRVGRLPSGIGYKQFNLELKTAEVSGAEHHVTIDTAQLYAYAASPIPTYYAVPRPFWTGAISPTAPPVPGLPSEELGFRRANAIAPSSWFGDWMQVIPASVLHAELVRLYPSGGAPATTRLFRHCDSRMPATVMAGDLSAIATPDAAGTAFLGWGDFFDRMSACGGRTLPSLIALPKAAGASGVIPPHRRAIDRDSLVSLLTADGGQARGEYTFYSPRQPNAAGEYLEYEALPRDALAIASDAETASTTPSSLVAISIEADFIADARR